MSFGDRAADAASKFTWQHLAAEGEALRLWGSARGKGARMGSAKSELVQQRRMKMAALKPVKVAFEEHMAQKRKLRQLFKLETPRRQRLAVSPGGND